MKHNYIIRLAIFALILLPISIKAADLVRVHGIKYELIGDEATVTSDGITYSGVLTIPSSINYNGRTYQVTSIGSGAFFKSFYQLFCKDNKKNPYIRVKLQNYL